VFGWGACCWLSGRLAAQAFWLAAGLQLLSGVTQCAAERLPSLQGVSEYDPLRGCALAIDGYHSTCCDCGHSGHTACHDEAVGLLACSMSLQAGIMRYTYAARLDITC
jgi:hypothetical protein